MRLRGALQWLLVSAVIVVIGSLWLGGAPIRDEAMRAGRDAACFPAAGVDYFHNMDGGVALTAQEIAGRNTWLVWSCGKDRFWDGMTATTFGGFDLLKTNSSHPGPKFDRDSRWSYLGLINEPCFDKPTGPDPTHFGLWLDKRRAASARSATCRACSRSVVAFVSDVIGRTSANSAAAAA
jgi:hypothetical protein